MASSHFSGSPLLLSCVFHHQLKPLPCLLLWLLAQSIYPLYFRARPSTGFHCHRERSFCLPSFHSSFVQKVNAICVIYISLVFTTATGASTVTYSIVIILTTILSATAATKVTMTIDVSSTTRIVTPWLPPNLPEPFQPPWHLLWPCLVWPVSFYLWRTRVFRVSHGQ